MVLIEQVRKNTETLNSQVSKLRDFQSKSVRKSQKIKPMKPMEEVTSPSHFYKEPEKDQIEVMKKSIRKQKKHEIKSMDTVSLGST